MRYNKERWDRLIPTLPKEKLQQMRKNALSADNRDLVKRVEQELDRRFSGWRKTRGWGKATPTAASFKGEARQFSSQVQAFLFLCEKFVDHAPHVLEEEDWAREFVAGGRAGRFFAKNPTDLWDASPHLVDDPSHYAWVSADWCVSTNLNLPQKQRILFHYAAAAGWKYESDWSFQVENSEPVLSLEDLRKLLD